MVCSVGGLRQALAGQEVVGGGRWAAGTAGQLSTLPSKQRLDQRETRATSHQRATGHA